MFRSMTMISLLTGVLLSAAVIAQAPSTAPSGSTGLCRDGSYWSGATKKGACRGHKGVQDWYAGAAAGAAATTAAPAPAAAASATPPPVTETPVASRKAPPPAATPAPGGGAGQVWVNTGSKVYHCPSDRWYGKTKNGAYMSEADAIAKGNRADHGKPCK